MRALRPYLALAALVFLGVIVATLPASVLLRALPERITLDGVSGTLWDGAAEQVHLDGVALGAFRWQLAPLALLALRVDIDIALTRPDGSLNGRVRLERDGVVEGDGLRLDLPLTTLHPEHSAASWDGRVAGTVTHVRLVNGWPVALDAQLTLTHLHAPDAADDLGNYTVTFDPHDATPTALLGRLHDNGGPLTVQAQLRLEQARAYRLDGDVAPRGPTSESIARALAFLGAPEPDGRRPIAITGTF